MGESPAINEKTLHYLWRTSRLFDTPLQTLDGRSLEIVQRGLYNLDSGPDFRQAAIRLQNTLIGGAVEMHLDSRDWYTHGHHQDPAYNEVILHVALKNSLQAATVRLENGCTIPQLILSQDQITTMGNIHELSTAALPFFDCPLRHTNADQILLTLQKTSFERFTQKVERFSEQIKGSNWDQLLYEGVCEALGYAKNQTPFRKLARLVPIDLLFSELRENRGHNPDVLTTAILFGAAGLLSPPERHGITDYDITQYLHIRKEIWEHLRYVLQIQPMGAAEWQFFRLRPQNFPTRRIAGLAGLILKFYHSGMLETMVSLFSENRNRPTLIIRELRAFFTVPSDAFWEVHFDFRSRPPIPKVHLKTLIGQGRADDMIINIILPVIAAFARDTENAQLFNQVIEIYSAFPALQDNVLTRKMRRQLFPAEAKKTPPQTKWGARLQQGLIQLYKGYCRSLRCESCRALTLPAAKLETEI